MIDEFVKKAILCGVREIVLFLLATTALSAQIPDGSTLFTPSKPQNVTSTASGNTAIDLQEDIRSIKEDLKNLSLRMDDLTRQNESMRKELDLQQSKSSDKVTLEQLELAKADLKQQIAAQADQTQKQLLDQIQTAQTAIGSTPVIPQPVVSSDRPNSDPVVSKLLAPASAEEKAEFFKQGIEYTVAAGDTLSAIAREHHCSMRAIVVANGLTDPNKLVVGKKLFIPTL